MTAHGAKGLQAPLVILADATADPQAGNRGDFVKWAPEGHDDMPFPVFRPGKTERGGPVDAAVTLADARELEEHWRLFYVAATRAEERLVIAGALGPKAKGEAPAASWYAAARAAFDALGVEEGEGERVFAGTRPQPAVARKARDAVAAETVAKLPDWAKLSAPVEARPPRPLAPSSLGDDLVSDPPPGAGIARGGGAGAADPCAARAIAVRRGGAAAKRGRAMAGGRWWTSRMPRSEQNSRQRRWPCCLIRASPNCSGRMRWPKRRSQRWLRADTSCRAPPTGCW